MKLAIKRLISASPAPLGRLLVRALCAAGALDPAYRVLFKLGRPDRVLTGPFTGMWFAPVTTSGSPLPKLLGTYERELHPVLERLAAEPCDTVIDVGSAEGYYAVGLTLRLRPARTFCYDIDARGHALMRRNAERNGVAERVTTGGACTPAELDRLLRGASAPLVFCDIEGHEAELLCPDLAPHLRRARVVVEVHDWATEPGAPLVSKQVRARFDPTHDVEVIAPAARTPQDFPAAAAAALPAGTSLSDAERRAALNEGGRNPSTHWLLFRPRAGVA
jgi:predicted O-methyltransferase YrrM